MSASMKDFRVLQMLGKGSYGSVYKCKRNSDGYTYAVKEVNIRKLSAREREDAVNEIRILASIRHKNIIRYCEAFVERDNLYIVMEFAEHGDTHRQIKKFKEANKYIKETTIWSYLIQICLGLQELHSRNILHRDIKPKNIFLTDKNHIRLGDLGCAKLIKSGMAKTQIGTPYYMSPEIWSNKPYDTKSDMWAVGAFIYELCALHPPFLANDVNGLARKIKTQPAPRVSRHYSEELAMIVARLLSKNPSTRPSINEVMEMPAIQKHMHLLPNNDDGGRYQNAPQSQLLATIKVPPALGRPGRNCQLDLPDAAYPEEDASTDAASASGGSSSEKSKPRDAPVEAKGPLTSDGTSSSDKSKPRNALAEAKARGYKHGGMGIANNAKGAQKPLRERTNVSRQAAAARRPAGAARRYVSAAQAIGKIPRPRPRARPVM
eukprot:gb/GECG01016712.1/.p1 GENE.gb/GECG01016712.1/~~gb/GECG01016712.1/.p1  ORF type:complete len:434 (+),score=43.15 gb/GECG01016712.1/:1-1302(+)